MPDHLHILGSIPLRISVSSFMGYLKGKSALMMFDNTPISTTSLEIDISGRKVIMYLMKPQLRNIFKIKEIIQWMISSRV